MLNPGGRACTVTDSEWIIRHRTPLAAYFPETVTVDLERYPRSDQLYQAMRAAGLLELAEHQVESPFQLTDAQAYRDKAFSSLHLISEEAFERGLQRMERDLEAGPILGISRYVLLWGAKARRELPRGHVSVLAHALVLVIDALAGILNLAAYGLDEEHDIPYNVHVA